MMLSTAVQRFLEASEPPVLSQSTHISYRSDLLFLVAVAKVEFTDNVVDFTSDLVTSVFQKWKAKGLSQATLHRRRASLSQLAKWCLRERLIAESPLVPSIKRPRKLPRPIPSDEQDRILALPLTGLERVIRGLLSDAGLRVSEIGALRIEDVELGQHEGEGKILIHGKGAKERSIPLTPALWHILRDYILSSGDLSTTDREGHLKAFVIAQPNGKPFSRRMIERRTKKWGRAVQASHTTPHRFRHRFATELLERKADLRQVQELMGHADLSTTAIYTEVTDQRRREAINLLDRGAESVKVLGLGSAPPEKSPSGGAPNDSQVVKNKE